LNVLGKTKVIHCVGVGGSGLSAVAEVLARSGFRVTGSDEKASAVTARLAAAGVTVHIGHAAAHVGDADVVVRSSAVRPANVEIRDAERRGIPVVLRGEMLAEIMRTGYGIAVAGAHGKTTTAAMIAVMLERAGLDPTALIGGDVTAFRSNARRGASEYIVAEADESDRSFLRLSPAVAVITNVDREHLENYAGFEDLAQSFVAFANAVPFYGAAVVCADDAHLRSVRPAIRVRTVAYGLDAEDADVTARDLRLDSAGSRLTVVHRTRGGAADVLGTLHVRVPGRHNAQNALGAVAVGLELGLPFESIAAGLEAFSGTGRRFERRGEAHGVAVVDDYGHHPTEVATVLQTARAIADGRVIVVFQPHRYSRTARLRDEFATALAEADEVVLTDIYASGEEPIEGVTIEWLAEAVAREAPGRTHLVKALDDVAAFVAARVRPGDLVITLGAGSVGEAGVRILEEVRRCR
jgi:UDP-N-acetylmuramate--alanine ligase